MRSLPSKANGTMSVHTATSVTVTLVHVCTSNNSRLTEFAPKFYRPADAQTSLRRKRHEKLEPLYDRFNADARANKGGPKPAKK